MLVRERLEHQDEKCDLCSKSNQVLWAGSGGELSLSLIGRSSRITISVVIILNLSFEGDCAILSGAEHRNLYAGTGVFL